MFARLVALVASIAFLIACNASPRSVASDVLYDGQAPYAKQVAAVERIAHDELAQLAKRGWTLPAHRLAVVPAYAARALTITSERPVRHTVIMYAYAFVDERQVRFSVAHEVYHVLAAERGLSQDERLADAFAACEGSKLAKDFAVVEGRASGDCDEVRSLLTK